MRFVIRFAMIALISTPALAASDVAGKDYQQSLSDLYKSCTQMAVTQPKETLIRAQKWYEESKQLAAQHCIALAQFELKDYQGAGETLDNILLSLDKTQGNLWYSMKKQAAKAHLFSGNSELAERHLTDALRYASDHNLDKDMVPLLIDRARLYGAKNEHLRAIQDLDHALSLNNSAPVVLERARIYLKMGNIEAAERDIRSVLKVDALNEEASQMLGELERRMNELKAEKNMTPQERQKTAEEAEQERQSRALDALDRETFGKKE